MILTNKSKAQLVIMTTFILGVIVGASSQYLLTRQTIVPQSSTTEQMVNEMAREVDFDANQRSQVDRIMDDTRRQYQDLRNQVRPQFNAIRDASRRRIREILKPEQQARFDRWMLGQDAKRAREEAAKNK